MGRKIAAYSNSDLLLEYERVLSEAVKAANGWNRRSEEKLNREADVLKVEIVRRLEACHKAARVPPDGFPLPWPG